MCLAALWNWSLMYNLCSSCSEHIPIFPVYIGMGNSGPSTNFSFTDGILASEISFNIIRIHHIAYVTVLVICTTEIVLQHAIIFQIKLVGSSININKILYVVTTESWIVDVKLDFSNYMSWVCWIGRGCCLSLRSSNCIMTVKPDVPYMITLCGKNRTAEKTKTRQWLVKNSVNYNICCYQRHKHYNFYGVSAMCLFFAKHALLVFFSS